MHESLLCCEMTGKRKKQRLMQYVGQVCHMHGKEKAGCFTSKYVLGSIAGKVCDMQE